jgi:hypothetical protein
MTLEKRQRRKYRPFLYMLQRRFGVPAELHSQLSVEPNYETGDKGRQYRISRIRRLITLTAEHWTETERTLSVLSASRQTVYGGFFDVADRIIVYVTPEKVEFGSQDYFVYDDTRWRVVKWMRLDYGLGYVVATRNTQNEPITDI